MKYLSSYKLSILLYILNTTIPMLGYAQTPSKFHYQVQIRDVTGKILTSESIAVRISILENNNPQRISYAETHSIITDAFGIINLIVGEGLPLEGSLSSISWDEQSFYIQLEIDENGGTNYRYLGSTQILPVPYAVYSSYADSAGGITIKDEDHVWRLDKPKNLFYTDGYIGIGTENPQRALHIVDSVESGELRYMIKAHNPSNGILSTCGIQLSAGSSGSLANINFTSDSYFDSSQEDAASRLSFGTNGKSISFSVNRSNGYIRFATGGQTGSHAALEGMRIDSAGNVGIGTPEPQRVLHVNDVIRLEPRDTSPEDPAEGDLYMDAVLHKLRVFDGAQWQDCW